MIPKLMSSSIASSSPKPRGKKWIVIITSYVQLPFTDLIRAIGHQSHEEVLWIKMQGSPVHLGLEPADNIMINFISLAVLENTNHPAQSRLLDFM